MTPREQELRYIMDVFDAAYEAAIRLNLRNLARWFYGEGEAARWELVGLWWTDTEATE